MCTAHVLLSTENICLLWIEGLMAEVMTLSVTTVAWVVCNYCYIGSCM